MRSANKFLFDTSFEAAPAATPASAEAAPAEPVEVTYTEADLAAARRQAFLEGEAAGETAMQASIERTVSDALTRLADNVGQLLRLEASTHASHQRAALETAVAIVRKLYPELARQQGLTEIEGVLAQAVTMTREEPRIVVRLHDSLLDPLRARVDEVARKAGYEGRVVLIADDAISPGDCRIEWADGGVERDTARLWREIETAMNRALALPSAEPAPALEAAAA